MYCSAHPPAVKLEIDHIVAVANGGSNEIDNLVTACEACNRGKSCVPLDSIPQPLRDKAQDIAEREEQLKGYSEIIEAKRRRIEFDAWKVLTPFIELFKSDGVRRDWFISTKRFVEKLGVHECMDAMEIALAKKPYYETSCFLYFCGVCWRKIERSDG